MVQRQLYPPGRARATERRLWLVVAAARVAGRADAAGGAGLRRRRHFVGAVGAGLVAAGERRRPGSAGSGGAPPVSYTHLRAHETVLDLVCRLLLEKKKTTIYYQRVLLNIYSDIHTTAMMPL